MRTLKESNEFNFNLALFSVLTEENIIRFKKEKPEWEFAFARRSYNIEDSTHPRYLTKRGISTPCLEYYAHAIHCMLGNVSVPDPDIDAEQFLIDIKKLSQPIISKINPNNVVVSDIIDFNIHTVLVDYPDEDLLPPELRPPQFKLNEIEKCRL